MSRRSSSGWWRRPHERPDAARDAVARQARRRRAGDGSGTLDFRERKPPWLKVKAPGGPEYRKLKHLMRSQGLHTVCEEANCPNIGECWERGTATFMILGDVCTRRCGFCNVKSGVPSLGTAPSRCGSRMPSSRWGCGTAVVTSVDRDDLPDYGARGFRRRRSARSAERAPGLRGRGADARLPRPGDAARRVIDARPDVFNHNVETVPRLYPLARRGSEFLRSCRVLRNAEGWTARS